MQHASSINDKTYIEIQKLLKFVDFISTLSFATSKDKASSLVIKQKIIHINQPETYSDWNICLNMYDYKVQSRINGAEGVFWRTWSVFFENATLEIEAKSEHSDDIIGYYDKHFYYFGHVNFKSTDDTHAQYLTTDIDLFTRDAYGYESYVEGNLKELEIDVSL